MQPSRPCVLTINGGSSSIRFAVDEAGNALRRQLDGKIDRIGLRGTNLAVIDPSGKPQISKRPKTVALFCYQAKKWIGSFASALGGLDALVFAGGIGENAPVVRKRICEGLGFLGIELDQKRNAQSAPLISKDAGPVKVRVIRTDEELMIARSVTRVLKLGSTRTMKR